MILYDFVLHFMDDTERLLAYRKRDRVLANPQKDRDTKRKMDDFLRIYDYNESCIRQGRLANCTIPDHCYKNWNEDVLMCNNIQPRNLTLKDVFMKVLPSVCEILFYVKDDVVYVKEEQWDYWQHISRSFSPMVLKVIFLWSKNYAKGQWKDVIKKNFENTSLPATEKFLGKNLADVHLHWNEGKEADRAVLDIIKDPSKYIKQNRITGSIEKFKALFGDSVFEDIYELAFEGEQYITTINTRNIENPFAEDELLMRHAWLLLYVFTQLKDKGKFNDFIALHYHLLVLGELRKRLVVQVNQYGLEQFNHTLKTPYRGASDFEDGKQVKQILGNSLNVCNRIEFRISPNQLNSINEIREGIKRHIPLENRPIVGFVCSVSKSTKYSDSKKSAMKHDLKNVIERDIQPESDKIVGVDITGKDFGVSPAAFVDFINTLRVEYKFDKFTYHAGEDFFHIISGMRTIYEVIRFLKFDNRCRIGHASAAGIDPMKWAWCVKGVVPMSQGEYLYDMIFVYHFIKERRVDCLYSKCKQIEKRILDLASRVYKGSNFTLNFIIDAWLSRTVVIDEVEYNKIIKVDCFEMLDSVDIRILQKALLHYIADNGCAIEACPTSNVSIGYDHELKSYHLKTWLKWKHLNICKVPDIVIGSDEVGTFPTNIANEYACIYDMLKTDADFDDGLIDGIINELMECSNRRAFANIVN